MKFIRVCGIFSEINFKMNKKNLQILKSFGSSVMIYLNIMQIFIKLNNRKNPDVRNIGRFIWAKNNQTNLFSGWRFHQPARNMYICSVLAVGEFDYIDATRIWTTNEQLSTCTSALPKNVTEIWPDVLIVKKYWIICFVTFITIKEIKNTK